MNKLILEESFDPGFQTIAFHRADGWTVATRLAAGYTLIGLDRDELERFLELARE